MSWLKPVEKIYQLAGLTQNFLYRHEVLQTHRLPVPVISVGNLSFGGSGKTPAVVFLASKLAQFGKVCVVSKSYKASAKKPGRVEPHKDGTAAKYGDEARLLAQLLAEVSACEVWSGPDKTDTARQCLDSQPAVILIDDGFSHYKLKRNFDLVLIDGTRAFQDYQREPLSSISRASAVLITKENLAPHVEIEQIKKQIQEQAPLLTDSIYLASSDISLNLPLTAPVFLFCGLARPESVVKNLKMSGFHVAESLFFSDHQIYGKAQIDLIKKRWTQFKKNDSRAALVTTQKDFTKINPLHLDNEIKVIQHKLKLSEKEGKSLVEKIRQSF